MMKIMKNRILQFCGKIFCWGVIFQKPNPPEAAGDKSLAFVGHKTRKYGKSLTKEEMAFCGTRSRRGGCQKVAYGVSAHFCRVKTPLMGKFVFLVLVPGIFTLQDSFTKEDLFFHDL